MSAFDVYVDSIRNRRRSEAEQHARNLMMMQQAAEAVAGVVQQVQAKKQANEQYKYMAEKAGTFDPAQFGGQPGYIQAREKILDRLMARDAELAQSAETPVRVDVRATPSFRGSGLKGQPGVEKIGMDVQAVPVMDERAIAERQALEAKGQKVQGQVDEFKERPDYEAKVEKQKGREFLKQNPIGSATYWKTLDLIGRPVEKEETDELSEYAAKQYIQARVDEQGRLPDKKKDYISDLSKRGESINRDIMLSEEDKLAKRKIITDAIRVIGEGADRSTVDEAYSAALLSILEFSPSTMEDQEPGFWARRKQKKQEREAKKYQEMRSALESMEE